MFRPSASSCRCRAQLLSSSHSSGPGCLLTTDSFPKMPGDYEKNSRGKKKKKDSLLILSLSCNLKLLIGMTWANSTFYAKDQCFLNNTATEMLNIKNHYCKSNNNPNKIVSLQILKNIRYCLI